MRRILAWAIFACLPATVFAGSPKGSVFMLDLKWKNEASQEVRIDRFKGRWVIVSMMYTSCQSSCPMIVQKLLKLEKQLKSENKKAEFLLVTFDPDRDTPAHLKRYREKNSLNEAVWNFWSGSEADTRKLSMALGIKYAKDPETDEFMHDNKVVLLGPDGVSRSRIENLNDDPAELLRTVPASR